MFFTFCYGAQKSMFILSQFDFYILLLKLHIKGVHTMVCALCLQAKTASKLPASRNPCTLGGGRRVSLRSDSTRLPIPTPSASRKILSDTSQTKVDNVDGGRDSVVTSRCQLPPTSSCDPHIELQALVDSVQGRHPSSTDEDKDTTQKEETTPKEDTTPKEAREGFDYTIVYHNGRTIVICGLHPCVTRFFLV